MTFLSRLASIFVIFFAVNFGAQAEQIFSIDGVNVDATQIVKSVLEATGEDNVELALDALLDQFDSQQAMYASKPNKKCRCVRWDRENNVCRKWSCPR